MDNEFLCKIIGHRRCAIHAQRVDGKWQSRCKRCGTKLIRVSRSNWQEADETQLTA